MEIMVEFILRSQEFLVDEVYEKIGISEGNKSILDEARFKTLSNEDYIRPKECSITYSTGYIETIRVADPIDRICSILLPNKIKIAKAINQYGLSAMFCIIISLTDNPEVSLSQEFIQLAAFLKAKIDFDTYLDYDNEDKPISFRNIPELK